MKNTNTLEKIQFHARKHGFEFEVEGNTAHVFGRELIMNDDSTVTFQFNEKAIKTYKNIGSAVKAVYNTFGPTQHKKIRRKNDIELAEQIAKQYRLPVTKIDDNELNNGEYFLHFSISGTIRLFHVTDLISEHDDVLEAVQALNNIVNKKETNEMVYTNVKIEKVRTGYYTVTADSKKFGPQQIVFEGTNKAGCEKFVERANGQNTYFPNMSTYYVTMTDTFLSGWGHAENRISKYIIECDSYEEANIVYNNAKARTDMKDVSIAYKKPYYSPKTHHTALRTKEDVPAWFIPDHFKKQLKEVNKQWK